LLLPYTWSLKIKVKKSTSLRDLIACGHAKRLPLSIAHSSQPLKKKKKKFNYIIFQFEFPCLQSRRWRSTTTAAHL
jgi:hypothetical protein